MYLGIRIQCLQDHTNSMTDNTNNLDLKPIRQQLAEAGDDVEKLEAVRLNLIQKASGWLIDSAKADIRQLEEELKMGKITQEVYQTRLDAELDKISKLSGSNPDFTS